MKHIAAYLLLQLGGNASPSAGDIKSLLDTVGIEAEQEKLDKLISELEGKDINEVGGLFIFPNPRSGVVDERGD
jgi:large subunit ribosomal protein LP2